MSIPKSVIRLLVPRAARDYVRLRLLKNRAILADGARPARPGTVNYDWWAPPKGDQANLGDYLAVTVNDWMLAQRGIDPLEPVGETRFLSSIGSILQADFNDATVWGSGLLDAQMRPRITPQRKRLDIRAVRGPRTQAELERIGYACPKVYGDPAILMPLVYPRRATGGEGPLLIRHVIAQVVDDARIARAPSLNTRDHAPIIDRICASDLVISSSLHGIILAEAYGVPAILLADSRQGFSLFKYEDWYLSTGRPSFPIARTTSEALALSPPPPPDLANMREKLMAAFPYDLWEPRRPKAIEGR